MKKITLAALAFAAAVNMTAQGLDLQSRAMLRRNAVLSSQAVPGQEASRVGDAKKSKTLSISTNPSLNNEYTYGFVTIADGYDRSDLESAGFNVLAVRGNIAIVGLPTDSAVVMSKRQGIKKLSLQKPIRPLMDLARADGGVDDIHNGVGLDLPYTGKGVMTGIVDQGVDPNHISFLKFNDEYPDGKTRVRYLTYLDGTADKNGNPNISFYGDDLYYTVKDRPVYYPTADKFTTDLTNAYHGTHTMNILAGGYRGDVTVPLQGGRQGATTTKKNPYYGVAPDADIAVSCGELQDILIAYGIDYMLGYAEDLLANEGKPTVLSLSLGSSAGPHDPNNTMNKFLEMCGEDNIIVIAAGNEGDLKIACKKEMADGDNTMGTFIYPYSYRYDPKQPKDFYNNYIRYGSIVIYASDDRQFSINAFVYDMDRGRVTASLQGIEGEEGKYYCSDKSFQEYENDIVNSTLGRYYNGYIGGGTMLDTDLNRYYGVLDYYLYNKLLEGVDIDENGSENVLIGFQVVGQPGQRIECYGDGFFTWMSNYGIDKTVTVASLPTPIVDGSRDGTISDMAVGENVLVVGAYTLRKDWTTLSGDYLYYNESDGFVIGDIGQYSSYGTLADGRTLPHVCAPGSAVVSALSRPYIEADFKGYESQIPQYMVAKASLNGKDYYWAPETGTSMSTPFVAGSIALWLEADPTLKINDVKEIIAKTARRDSYVENGNQVQWGAGKFDALAGLKEVIRRAGVQGVTIDSNNDRLILTPTGMNVFDVFVGDADSLNVRVFGLTGACLYNNVFDGCEASIDLSNLSAGVYAVNVNGHSKKIVIR